MGDLGFTFESAPQNPYLFAILFLLAIISSWSPLLRLIRATREFYSNTIHIGIIAALRSISTKIDVKADAIVANPAHGTMILIMDMGSIAVSAINVVCLLLIGIGLINVVGLQGGSEKAPMLVALVSIVTAGISFIMLGFEMIFEAVLFRRVRAKLK
jgi:hypothetical protein